MNTVRKDAGRARERPQVTTSRPAAEAAGEGVVRQPAGAAPRLDRATRELQQPRKGTPGMLANPWVKRFTSGQNPPAEPGPQAEQPQAEQPREEPPTAESRPQAIAPSTTQVDAGAAPDIRPPSTSG
jgi:hypothetical protein